MPAAILQRLAKLEAAVLPPPEPEHHHRRINRLFLEDPGAVLPTDEEFDRWFSAHPCPGGCNGAPSVLWSADAGFRYWP
jgi:hypothetical protein